METAIGSIIAAEKNTERGGGLRLVSGRWINLNFIWFILPNSRRNSWSLPHVDKDSPIPANQVKFGVWIVNENNLNKQVWLNFWLVENLIGENNEWKPVETI